MESLNMQHNNTGTHAGRGAGSHVNKSDLANLRSAITHWEYFISAVFALPVAGKITYDILDQISLEDSDHYLDVKIQLTQCFAAKQDTDTEQKLQKLCGEIKKTTYSYIASTLPNYGETNSSLLEMAQKNHQHHAEDSAELDFLSASDITISLEYKDCLVSQHKQLKLEILRQRSIVRNQIDRLKKNIEEILQPPVSDISALHRLH